MTESLAATIDAAWAARDTISPATTGAVRDAVNAALAMLDDGLLERFPFEEIYGLHNMPGIAAGRFETTAEYNLLQSIYSDLSLYFNFFQPVLKLTSKEITDGRTIKHYDTAATPYQRVLAAKEIPFEIKARLMNIYVQLNPVTLRNSIDQKIHQLCTLSR